jgi:hypothetical protein
MSTTKKRVQHLVTATEAAFAKAAAQASKFKKPKEFKGYLLKTLDKHPEFSHATQALHEHALALFQSVKNQFPRQIIPSGRVQAPRHDSPKGSAARGKRN